MDSGPLRTLALNLNLNVHGVAATVTLKNEPPIAARVLWTTPIGELVPATTDFERREPQRIAVISRAVVPKLPRGTRIDAPAKAGDVEIKAWQVDGTERQEPESHRVYVVEIEL